MVSPVSFPVTVRVANQKIAEKKHQMPRTVNIVMVPSGSKANATQA